MILDAQPDITVVAEAADGVEAVEQTRLHRPDVALVDVRMPRLDGIAATRRIVELSDPATHVLILTTFDLDEYVYEAVRAGASGFLLKDAPPAKLAEGVRTVAVGEALLAPSITRRLLERFARRAPIAGVAPGLADLTAREREVLAQVARGLSNAEIARVIGIGEATVKTHVTRLLSKLELRDRVQVVIFAYEWGLVGPGTSRDSAARMGFES